MAYANASQYWNERRARDNAHKAAIKARQAAIKAQPFTTAVFASNKCSSCGGPITSNGYCIAPITGPGACRRAYTD